MDRSTVAERIHRTLPELTPAERKVGRALLADYPRAGLTTSATLANAAGVSPPTVVRFATSLAFPGFAALQEALRDEVAVSAQGPLGRDGWGSEPEAASTPTLTDAAQLLADSALATARSLHPSEWRRAVQAVADPTQTVLCVGGRYTGALAEMLTTVLTAVRPGVHHLRDLFGVDAAWLVDLGPRTVVVAFDLPRYQASTIEVVALARARRATVVLVTDDRLSPAASDADVVLTASTVSPSPFASVTSTAVIIDLLLRDVLDELGPAAKDRLTQWEAVRRPEFHLHP